LNYVGSSLGIKNLGSASQEVCECLTVSAVAHDPVHALWMADVSFESSTCALQWMIHCHFATEVSLAVVMTAASHPKLKAKE
jgi:hypothetical protein